MILQDQYINMQKTVSISELVYDDVTSEIKNLLNQSKRASSSAYAPFSEFYVGCSVLHQNGTIIRGSNQENSSFPSGMCAERVALFESSKNLSNNKVSKIAIYAKSNRYKVPDILVPCAGCLQVISDIRNRQKSSIEIWMWGGGDIVFMAEDISQFLPFHFELTKK